MKKILPLLILTITIKLSLACSCYPSEPNFYKNISPFSNNYITVFDSLNYSYEYNGLQSQTSFFTIIDTIGNNNSNSIGDQIVVTGQDGLNCGESLFDIYQGDTLLLALHGGFYESFQRDTFYLEGSCGKHYIKIKNGEYAGLSIPEIKAKIQQLFNLDDISCNCTTSFNNYDFFNNTTKVNYNCLAVFQNYNYSYSYNGLNSQVGAFVLLDKFNDFDSSIGDTIYVTGEDGANCGEMLNRFSAGDTMFLALTDGFYENFSKDTFYLKGGVCGRYYLQISNGEYFGLTIPEIKDSIQTKITSILDVEIQKGLTISPNPTSDVFHIRSKNASILNVEVYDITGKLIQQNNSINHLNTSIDISKYNSGLYHVIIHTESGIINKKVLKN